MTNPEEFGELSPVEQHELRLLGEIYPLQKVLCDGLKYHIWRKQEKPSGPPEISDDDFELARKTYQRELSDWLYDICSLDNDPLLTSHIHIQKRMDEVRNETLSVFDINTPNDDHEHDIQGLNKMQSLYEQYLGRQDVSEDFALRRTIEQTCELATLTMMRELFNVVSDRSGGETS